MDIKNMTKEQRDNLVKASDSLHSFLKELMSEKEYDNIDFKNEKGESTKRIEILEVNGKYLSHKEVK